MPRLTALLCLVVSVLCSGGCASLRLAAALRAPEIPENGYSADDHINFGVVYERDGDFKQALRHYRIAKSMQPQNPIPYTNEGNILYNHGHWKEAERCYRDALRCAPQYVPALNNLVVITVDKRDDPASALILLQSAFTAEEIAASELLSERVQWAEQRLRGPEMPTKPSTPTN